MSYAGAAPPSLFVGAQPFFSLLYVEVKTPFFINVTMSSLGTSEQTGGNGGTLKSAVFGLNMRHPSTEFLNIFHRLKGLGNSHVNTIHLHGLFLSGLTPLLSDEVIQSFLIEFNRPSATRSVCEVKLSIFECCKPFLNGSFSYILLSVHGTNVSSGFGNLGALIESEEKQITQVLVFVDLAINFLSL